MPAGLGGSKAFIIIYAWACSSAQQPIAAYIHRLGEVLSRNRRGAQAAHLNTCTTRTGRLSWLTTRWSHSGPTIWWATPGGGVHWVRAGLKVWSLPGPQQAENSAAVYVCVCASSPSCLVGNHLNKPWNLNKPWRRGSATSRSIQTSSLRVMLFMTTLIS